jgi:hypothetical protein
MESASSPMERGQVTIAAANAGAPSPERWYGVTVLAAVVGLGLMAHQAFENSATYDEVAYMRVAARWWRTGDQESITRMGSPLTFWKIQHVPVLWLLDRLGMRPVVDDPIVHQSFLLPLVRLWSLWIWLIAFLLTALWSRLLYGPRAMAFASGLFALSPNLLAHGSLVTMELPIVASMTAILLLFWCYLNTRRPGFFWASAAVGGLAWSCKFTTALVPPTLALVWWADCWHRGDRGLGRVSRRVAGGMLGFLSVMVLSNLLLTGFATLPMSTATGAHPALERFSTHGSWTRLAAYAVEFPLPQDWVGFFTQLHHQRTGGASYLLGERRTTGWWYYYLVALAVKVPLTFWLLWIGRTALGRRVESAGHDRLLPFTIILFLVVTSAGSTRNYGIRYLLPLAPLAIVWVSALAEAGPWWRRLACVGLLGQAVAVASTHPHELSYFNAVSGGPRGGRQILSDSNLDWGQGAKALARLQRQRPEFRDLTLFYFGDTDPAHYGVVGRRHLVDASDRHPGLPPEFRAETAYLAVSASLQWGPWGPPGYFRTLQDVEPVATTPDCSISVYRVEDVVSLRQPNPHR